jgi:hypothetical protein
MITDQGHHRAVIHALINADPARSYRTRCLDDVQLALIRKGYARSERAVDRYLCRLTPDGIAARDMFIDVRDRYPQGASGRTLGQDYGVTDRTVLRWLDRMDVPIRRNGTKLDDAQRAQIAAVYRDGTSVAQLATRYDVSTFTIRTALRHAGVMIRPPGYPTPLYGPYMGRRITACT